MNIRVFKVDLAETNKLLLRCAIALENLSPKALDTEISEFVVDEAIESPQQRDESEGLDEIRRSY
jgi:hypothetical protein